MGDNAMGEVQPFIGVREVIVTAGSTAVFSVVARQELLTLFGIFVGGEKSVHIQTVFHRACANHLIQFII